MRNAKQAKDVWAKIVAEVDAGESPGAVATRHGVREGTLRWWRSRLKNGANSHRQEAPAADRFTAIGCGENVACGIKTDGTVSCWGSPNNPAVVNSVPTGAFVELAVSSESACARRSNSTVACWGWDPNNYGFLRPPTDFNFSRLVPGENTNCAYDNRNKLHCWGWHVRTPLEGTPIQ